MKITISGGFHNARPITIRATASADGVPTLSIRQMKRISSHMCGVAGCICGMSHGWEIDGTGRAELVEALQNAQIAEYNARI